MEKYARIVDTIVVEIVELPDEITPKDIFSPDIEGEWIAISDDVKVHDVYNGKNFTAPPPPPQPDLAVVKQKLQERIDSQAENERLKYITPGVGQSMTYTEKVNQASNYSKAYAAHLNDPDTIKAPNENEYLLLKSSLGIDGDTLAEVAENITWAYALWEQIGAAIETIRLQTKAAINAATTVEKAQAVFDGVKWPAPLILQ